MKIKVLCDTTNVPPAADGNTSFPANACDNLQRLGVVNLSTTYELGYPTYGEATLAVAAEVKRQPWVKSVECESFAPLSNLGPVDDCSPTGL